MPVPTDDADPSDPGPTDPGPTDPGPTPQPRDDAGHDPEGEVPEIGYAEAVAELECILDELEDDTVDVDVLARQVRRAAMLIRLCRTRITDARMEVEQIVGELDDGDPGPEP